MRIGFPKITRKSSKDSSSSALRSSKGNLQSNAARPGPGQSDLHEDPSPHGDDLPHYDANASTPPAYTPTSYKMALSPSQQSRSSATLASVANSKHGVDFESMYNQAVALVSKRDYSAALFLLRPQETQPEVEHNPAVQNIMAAAYRGAAHQLAKRPRPDSVYFERPPQGDMSSIALHSDYLALLSGAIQAGASELNSFRNQNTRAQHVGYYAGASLASFDLHIAPTLTEADRQHMSQPSVRHAYASDRGEAMVQYIEKRAIKQLDHDIDTAMNYIASIGQNAAQLATKKNWFAQSTKLLTKTPERTFVNSTAAINRQNSKQHVPAADFWKQWVQREQLKFSHSLEMELAVDFATFGS